MASTLVLPTRVDVPHYDFSVDLDGRTYTLELRWNERAGAWFLSTYDAEGVPVVSGRKVVLYSPLLGHTVDPRRPPGELFAIDTTGSDLDPGRYDLGGRVLLVYSGV